MSRLDSLTRDLPTILGVAIMSAATVAWLLGRIPIADWAVAAAFAGPAIGMRQRAPIPSDVPAPVQPVSPIPASPAADPAPASAPQEQTP